MVEGSFMKPITSFEFTQWVPFPSVVSGLAGVGTRSKLTVFDLNGETYLISGCSTLNSFYGYKWNGAGWSVNNTIINGLAILPSSADKAKPDVFDYNGSTYLIMGCDGGEFYGFKWNGSGWSEDTAIVNGLSDIGTESFPAVFTLNDNMYLIAGRNRSSYAFVGYKWNGAGWSSDNSIIAGLPTIGYLASPTVFYINKTLYFITGNSGGTFDGFEWDGANWIESIIDTGLTDIGDRSNPEVFVMNGKYYLIAGEYSGVFNGFIAA